MESGEGSCGMMESRSCTITRDGCRVDLCLDENTQEDAAEVLLTMETLSIEVRSSSYLCLVYMFRSANEE